MSHDFHDLLLHFLALVHENPNLPPRVREGGCHSPQQRKINVESISKLSIEKFYDGFETTNLPPTSLRVLVSKEEITITRVKFEDRAKREKKYRNEKIRFHFCCFARSATKNTGVFARIMRKKSWSPHQDSKTRQIEYFGQYSPNRCPQNVRPSVRSEKKFGRRVSFSSAATLTSRFHGVPSLELMRNYP